jgi:hypothetical protein
LQLSGSGLGLSLGGASLYYSPRRVQREHLDQTDLKNGVDVILGGGGGIFWKLLMNGPHRGPGGMVMGPASPTCHPLGVRYSVVSSSIL